MTCLVVNLREGTEERDAVRALNTALMMRDQSDSYYTAWVRGLRREWSTPDDDAVPAFGLSAQFIEADKLATALGITWDKSDTTFTVEH